MDIVNLSLDEAEMPNVKKKAVVFFLLKRTALDTEDLRNYRNMSNLSFVFKLIEIVVVERPVSYLQDDTLHEVCMSSVSQHRNSAGVCSQ